MLSRRALSAVLGRRLPSGGPITHRPPGGPAGGAPAGAAEWLSRKIAETRRRVSVAWADAENAATRYQNELDTVRGLAPGLPEDYIGADPRLLRAYNAMWDREAEYRAEAARLRNLQRSVPRRPSGPRRQVWR